MALMNLLPDLDKPFCNFELGLDAEHVCVTGIDDDQYEILQQSIPSDTEYVDDIKTYSESESTTLPPNIEYSTSSSNEDTDLDMFATAPVPTPSPTNIPTGPPQVVASLEKRRRKRTRRETACRLCNTNNPNPSSTKHKVPTLEQYKAKYKKCPWSQINIQRPPLSYDKFLFVM